MINNVVDIAKQIEGMFNTIDICKSEEKKVRAIIEKLEDQQITVSVIGQFKRGKSTLVNAILGDSLLPVGIVPVTSAVTRIKYGEKAAIVHFNNGVVKNIEVEQLSNYISEEENPENELGVDSVTLFTPSPFLKSGLTFVDTPGVGSIHKHNSDAAYAFVKESDAVIFMLSVDSPINEIEINFLKNAKEYAGKFYFSVNKIDNVSSDELKSYLNYCKKLLCQLMGIEEIMLFPVSAKLGDGVEKLKESIAIDCEASVKEILEASAKMKLKDIIDMGLAHLELYWKAFNMPARSFDEKYKEIGKTIETLNIKNEMTEQKIKENAERFSLKLKDELAFDREDLRKIEISNIKNELINIYIKGLESINQQCEIMSSGFEIQINEMKLELAEAVSKEFEMDYNYEIKELDITDENMVGSIDKVAAILFVESSLSDPTVSYERAIDIAIIAMLKDYMVRVDNSKEALASKFINARSELIRDLNETLKHILLYREDNAFVVVRKIEDFNKLTRHLRQIKNQLK